MDFQILYKHIGTHLSKYFFFVHPPTRRADTQPKPRCPGVGFCIRMQNGPRGPPTRGQQKGCELSAPRQLHNHHEGPRRARPHTPGWTPPTLAPATDGSVDFSSDTAKSMATPVLPTRGHCKAGTVGPNRVVSIPHCGPTQGISPPRRR